MAGLRRRGAAHARLQARVQAALPSPVQTPGESKLPGAARKASPGLPLEDALLQTQAAPAAAEGLPAESGGWRLSEYVPIELLSTRPRFLVDMQEYIPASLDASEAGRIVVQVLIGLDGEVDGVVLENSELSPRGTRRFIQRLDALRLAPGLRDGQPVKARWRMEFNFNAEP